MEGSRWRKGVAVALTGSVAAAAGGKAVTCEARHIKIKINETETKMGRRVAAEQAPRALQRRCAAAIRQETHKLLRPEAHGCVVWGVFGSSPQAAEAAARLAEESDGHRSRNGSPREGGVRDGDVEGAGVAAPAVAGVAVWACAASEALARGAGVLGGGHVGAGHALRTS